MEKILYFDIINGISGDMTLGALLDLGLNKEYFLQEIKKLAINDEFEVAIKDKLINGIKGTDVDVVLKKKDLESRNLNDIFKIINNSNITDKAKKISKDIFLEVAMAEAKVHSTTIEDIHFHEVGAVDSIVDIVGCSILIDMLNVDKIISSSVVLGRGFVKCDHGLIPVPSPASVEILKNCKVKFSKIKGETTTPTGAGIIKTICNEFVEEFEFDVERVGYGIGKKSFEVPNFLRVILGVKKN